MATGWPMKTTYANGDVYSASDVNDITGTINLLGASVAYTAGKNKIINGDFGVWQRGTSFSNPSNVYTADRWVAGTDATCTVSRQTFTPATAPVSGYEGTYYYRAAKSAGGTYFQANQKIEDVRAFAGQAITVSFWAKADSAITLAVQGYQNFGSGGSTQVTALNTSVTLTTSWARYSVTATLPNISGKTIGTSSYLMLPYLLYNGSSAVTIDIWGVQLEQGSTATAFQTATGTIQGELAACQRYYQRWSTTSALYSFIGSGNAESSIYADILIPTPVTFRIVPTAVEYSTLRVTNLSSGQVMTSLTIAGNFSSSMSVGVQAQVASGLTAGNPYLLTFNNSSSAYFALSAEL